MILPGGRLLAAGFTMIYKVFSLIEIFIFKILDGLVTLYSNKTLKSLSLVAVGLLTEVFMYIVLGVSCLFVSAIVQLHDIFEKRQGQPAEDGASVGSQLAPKMLCQAKNIVAN